MTHGWRARFAKEIEQLGVETFLDAADIQTGDVFEDEPKVHPGLMGLPNVVLAPHIGSASWETRLQMANLAVDNCLAVLEGRTPPTPVNAEALARR